MAEAQILVVEDDGVVAKDIKRQLEGLGYSVPAVTSSGEEAIRKVSEYKPDLVLMDILLKGKMDGVQATEQIQARFNIPIIYLTAHSDDSLLQRAKRTEPFGYILKPFAERELYSAIETALHKHKADEARKVLARRQRAVTALGQRALLGADLSDLMNWAVNLIAETLEVAYSTVLESLPDRKSLLLRAGPGRVGIASETIVRNGRDTEAGYALVSSAPVIVEDFHADQRFELPSFLNDAGVISSISVVIHGFEHPFGVLGAHATSKRVFGKDDANFLQSIANVLGIAIERRRSEDALLEVHNELEQRVEERTAELLTANALLKEEIGERQRAEEARSASEERYRALFENARDPIYVHDLDGIYLSVNPAAEKLSGYTRDEIIGKHFSDFVAPEYIAALNTNLRKKVEGSLTPTAYEIEVVSKDGRRLPVEINSSLIYENGEAVAVQGMARDSTERKQREEELRRSEAQYRELVENINDILYATDAEGVITYISQAIEDSIGLSPSDIMGHHFSEFIHPEDLPGLIEGFRQSARGFTTPSEFRMFDQAGKIIWLHKSSRSVFHGNRFAGTRGLLTDITEQRRTEEELRSTNQMLQTLIHSSPLAIAVQDREGNVTLWNPAAEKMLGWTEAEILGRPNPIAPSGKGAKFEALRQEVMGGQAVTNLDKVRFRKDGSPIYLSSAIAPLIGADGGSIGTVSIMADITERRQAQEALRTTNQTLNTLIQASPLAIIGLDSAGIVTMWNPAAENIFGWSERETLGRPIPCIPEEGRDEFRALRDVVMNGTVSTDVELRRKKKDGSLIDISLSTAPMRDAEGKIVGMMGIMADITDRKQVEKERAQLLRRLVTAQEEEQRRLSRELHDQMGQAVAALLLGLKSLDDSGQFLSPTKNRLHRLQELTNQLARDVHHLASSLRPTALDDLGLHTALSNYVEEWSERSKIAADFHSNGLMKQRLSATVETTVYRIVQEALTNVLKHSQAHNVSIIIEHRGNRVLAIVEDDGCGFDAEAMMHKPANERRLGLLGMEERVALVNGKLNIESTPDSGTTVLVHIPVSPEQLEAVAR